MGINQLNMMQTILKFCLIISATKAERVVIHEIQTAQRKHRAATVGSPFLSATLLASIAPLHVSSIDASQKTIFSTALTDFLKHVFEGQSVYNVEIISATIFDEQFAINTQNVRGRNLLTNQLQAGQFHFIHDGEEEDDDDGGYDDYDWKGDANDKEGEEEALSVMDAILGEGEPANGGKDDADGSDWVVDESEWLPNDEDSSKGSKDAYTLKVTTVISAEDIVDDQTLSHSEFQDILIHICTKFQDHLNDYVRTSDAYFANVESVTVSALQTNTGESGETMVGSMFDFEVKGFSAASIIGIVAAGIVFVLALIGSIKLVKRERHLKRNKWRSQEIASANAADSSVKSLRVLYNRSAGDDYSFDPFGTETPPAAFYKDSASDTSSYVADSDSNDQLRFRKPNGVEKYETVSFVSEPTETNSSLFSENSTNSCVYAPPGKVGVAIDVINGQPSVHKIRNGSPMEGLLQHGDIILSIDDVKTSNMSAADVTQLMVKRMNYRRKISFIRPGNQFQ